MRSRPQVFSILTVTWIVGAVAATRVTFPLWMAPAALVRFRRSKVSTSKETTCDMRRATFALPFALSWRAPLRCFCGAKRMSTRAGGRGRVRGIL